LVLPGCWRRHGDLLLWLGTTGGKLLRLHLGPSSVGNRFARSPTRPSRHASRAAFASSRKHEYPPKGQRSRLSHPRMASQIKPRNLPNRGVGKRPDVCSDGCAFLFGEGSAIGHRASGIGHRSPWSRLGGR